MPQHRVLLAAPRGYCAGVDRAILIVAQALERYGTPVYVRKQIVHNAHVVAGLRARGAVFVDELDEVPEGAVVADPAWLTDATTAGVTAGASAPEHLITGVLDWLDRHAYSDVELVSVAREDIRFTTPPLPERASTTAV